MTFRATRVTGVLAVGVLVIVGAGGCSKERTEPGLPEVSTVGVLKTEDLGPGDWSGPYETPSGGGRWSYCASLDFDLGGPSAEYEPVASAAWVDGEHWYDNGVGVWSVARQFSSTTELEEAMADVSWSAQTCILDEPPSPDDNETYFFGVEQTGDVLVTTEKRWSDSVEWEQVTAVTTTDEALVWVKVSYLADTDPDDVPDARHLLDKAVVASRELTTPEEE